MGSIISKAANGIGATIGGAFVAPIKSIFGISCEGVCPGTWDITCFIEHLCVSKLVKLLMVLCLTYITLMFVYLLFKVGIIQFIGRSLCKMAFAACHAYWSSLRGISCFLWHKLKNTKRVYRHRFKDIEAGYSSSDNDRYSESYGSPSLARGRRSVRERRTDRMRRSLYPVRHRSKGSYRSHSRHHVRLKTSEVSLHFNNSGVFRNSRPLKRRNGNKRRIR